MLLQLSVNRSMENLHPRSALQFSDSRRDNATQLEAVDSEVRPSVCSSSDNFQLWDLAHIVANSLSLIFLICQKTIIIPLLGLVTSKKDCICRVQSV